MKFTFSHNDLLKTLQEWINEGLDFEWKMIFFFCILAVHVCGNEALKIFWFEIKFSRTSLNYYIQFIKKIHKVEHIFVIYFVISHVEEEIKDIWAWNSLKRIFLCKVLEQKS